MILPKYNLLQASAEYPFRAPSHSGKEPVHPCTMYKPPPPPPATPLPRPGVLVTSLAASSSLLLSALKARCLLDASLEPTRHIPAPGPLHLLFPLPGCCLLDTCMASLLSNLPWVSEVTFSVRPSLMFCLGVSQPLAFPSPCPPMISFCGTHHLLLFYTWC